MSTRTKLGLGFKECNRSDEVFDLSTPSVFDPEPTTREVKSLYERFVKAGEMHEVSPSITGTFMPTPYQSDLEEPQVTFGSKSTTSSIITSESNDFVSCDNSDKSSESKTHDFASCVSSPKTTDSFSTIDVKILPKSDVKDPSPTNGVSSCSVKENVKPPRNFCNKSRIADRNLRKNHFVRSKTCFVCGSKSHLIKDCDVYDNVDTFPSVVSQAASVPAGSRNSSPSISADRSILAASINRPASIHAGRHVPVGSRNSSASISADRSIPAASRNRPASIHAGRRIPAGKFNKPSPFPAGRSVPTGCTNHAARPSIDHKYYSLVVTDDFSRFSWAFFLGTKDETFYILKDFLALIENQLNKKLKAIRCDNETEFQNAQLIDLYEAKGIRRDYSNARTPQQNRVVEHKNRTLIEASRSMLADSKLPTMFWTEAVSIACYVLNRVSITFPHNKTPYELLSGKVPNISHVKPFGCHVTILNTSDHLVNLKEKLLKVFLLGTQDTNLDAGTQDDDSDSECDEQAILVPSFPSNSFSGPKVNEVSAPMENHLVYAAELARLQRQETEAHSADKRDLVLAAGDSARSLVSTDGVTAGNIPAGSIPAGSIHASTIPGGSIPASSIPTGSIPASSISAGSIPASSILTGSIPAGSITDGSISANRISAGGVLAGSVDSAGFGDPAVSNSASADPATLPPGHSLGSSEHSTRFPSPSDLGNHQPSAGIFSSSSYDDEFCSDVTNLASSVAVDPVATKRVNTIHPQSQILGELQSPVLTRSQVQKSNFGGDTGRFGNFTHLVLGVREGFAVPVLQAKTVNRERQLQALVDGKNVIITESTIRRDLQLEDAKGVDCLPNVAIFKQLTLMGTMASVIICLATNQKFNFLKYIFESMVKNLDNVNKFLMYPRNMKRVGKGFFGRDTPLLLTMMVQAQKENGEEHVVDEAVNKEMNDSLERVATIATSSDAEQDKGVNTPRSGEDGMKLNELMELCTKLQQRVLDLEAKKPLKLWRLIGRIADIGANEDITLVSTHDEQMFDADQDLGGEEVFFLQNRMRMLLKMKLMLLKLTSEKAQQEEEANIALIESWNDVQEKIDTDYQLAKRLQAKEQQELNDEEKATLFIQLLKKRRKFFTAKRVEEKRNKPPTQAQKRKIMCTYLKNMEGKKLTDLKNKSFVFIQKMFDRAFKRVNTFVDYRTELIEESFEKAKEEVTKGRSKRAGEELEQKSSKKQKIDDDKDTTELKQLVKIDFSKY
nr:ribonuclease H-like domain-containing protein [Tanacetum cinerariifolium]